jgi:NADH:ubiquinone oxidoreductase subunit 6 (subunit J)
MDAFFFWLFSGGMIICALAVILNRNAVASALCFTFSIVFMAGLFVMLSAFFLAAVQILVTAGAVMVLFLFIIMLLDLTAMEHLPRQKIWMACSFLLGLGFLVIVAKVLASTPADLNIAKPPNPAASTLAYNAQDQRLIVKPQVNADGTAADVVINQSDIDKQDDTHRIGLLLFSTNVGPNQPTYVAPFEITSLLILVATVGVIVLCKQDEKPRTGPREAITREAPPIEPKKETVLRS